MNDTNSEAAKANQAYPRKQPGGLRKFFGRKKEEPGRQSVEGNRTGNTSLAPPSDQKLGRRLSLLRKQPTSTASPRDSQANVAREEVPELDGQPVMLNSIPNSTTNVSHVDSQEHHDAQREFDRFDQEPTDIPAITPQTSTPSLIAPQAQRNNCNITEQLSSKVATHDDNHTDMIQYGNGNGNTHRDDDTESEATMDEQNAPIVESKDRWAIIRENAARRAAARASEEQSSQGRPSQSQRTDDGETSGEESKYNST